MAGDWIKLHRKMLDWEWYDDANTMRVFVHLLIKANWKSGSWRGVEVPRGSLITSQLKIAEELKLSRQQVRTAMDKLKKTSEINHQITKSALLVKVLKYEDYNARDDGDQPENNHAVTPSINHAITIR